MSVKYDFIGIDYNLTRKADPYLVERLHYELKPKPDGIYLDIGCGTGNYTSALFEKGIQFIGVEPSDKMLSNAKTSNQNIQWLKGSAEDIPLKRESIDGCIASLTIHHWDSLSEGFKDIYRVLKPKSRLAIFTSTPKQMKGYWLNHYFPKMMQDSMAQMPPYEIIEENLLKNGFKIAELEPYFVKPDLQDLFLYAGKERPELYLNDQVRHGISSFSSLANKQEVETGLQQLKNDIENGTIGTVSEKYENDNGDYLFIVAEK